MRDLAVASILLSLTLCFGVGRLLYLEAERAPPVVGSADAGVLYGGSGAPVFRVESYGQQGGVTASKVLTGNTGAAPTFTGASGTITYGTSTSSTGALTWGGPSNGNTVFPPSKTEVKVKNYGTITANGGAGGRGSWLGTGSDGPLTVTAPIFMERPLYLTRLVARGGELHTCGPGAPLDCWPIYATEAVYVQEGGTITGDGGPVRIFAPPGHLTNEGAIRGRVVEISP